MKISELDQENKEKALAYQTTAAKSWAKYSNNLDQAFDWNLTLEGSYYWDLLDKAILVDNNRPSHYNNETDKDVIDFCQDYKLNFCRGSAIKYIVRAGKKEDEIDDLKKAIDFLQREIKNLEK